MKSAARLRHMGLHIRTPLSFCSTFLPAPCRSGGTEYPGPHQSTNCQRGHQPAHSQSLSALLAQLQRDGRIRSSANRWPRSQRFDPHGTEPWHGSAQLSLNESTAHTLEHAILRWHRERSDISCGLAFFHIERHLCAIFNSPAISQVIQNNSFQAAFPSFNYEDIGLSMKASPW